MAERRMFAKTIIDSDAFLDMPITARLLYYDLAMRADDDGFINAPKRIMRTIGASDDDLQILAAKKFIIPFENGVVVIKHWRIHNYIRKDTYNRTPYLEELAALELDENKAYTIRKDLKEIAKDGEPSTSRPRTVNEPSTQVRLGKVSIDKDSIGKVSIGESEGKDAKASTHAKKPPKQSWGEYQNVKLTKDEVDKLAAEYGEDMTRKAVKFLDEYIEMKGYKAKSHYLCIRKWVITAVKEQEAREHKEYKNPKAEELDHFYKMANDWAMKGELNEYEADNGYNTGDTFGDTSSYSGYGDN